MHICDAQWYNYSPPATPPAIANVKNKCASAPRTVCVPSYKTITLFSYWQQRFCGAWWFVFCLLASLLCCLARIRAHAFAHTLGRKWSSYIELVWFGLFCFVFRFGADGRIGRVQHISCVFWWFVCVCVCTSRVIHKIYSYLFRTNCLDCHPPLYWSIHSLFVSL